MPESEIISLDTMTLYGVRVEPLPPGPTIEQGVIAKWVKDA
jgi:hypothetical protein